MKTKFYSSFFFIFLLLILTSCNKNKTQEIVLSNLDNIITYPQGDAMTYVVKDCGLCITFPCVLELSDTTEFTRHYTGCIAEDDPKNYTFYEFSLERRSKALHGESLSNSKEEQQKELREKMKSNYSIEKNLVPDLNHVDENGNDISYECLDFFAEENGIYTAGSTFIKEDLLISFIASSPNDAAYKWEELFRTIRFIKDDTELPSPNAKKGIRQSFPFGYSFIVPEIMVPMDNPENVDYYYSVIVNESKDSSQILGNYAIEFTKYPKPYSEFNYQELIELQSEVVPPFEDLVGWNSYVRVPYISAAKFLGKVPPYTTQGLVILTEEGVLNIYLASEKEAMNEINKIQTSIKKL